MQDGKLPNLYVLSILNGIPGIITELLTILKYCRYKCTENTCPSLEENGVDKSRFFGYMYTVEVYHFDKPFI